MATARMFYDLAYRLGRPRWDTGQPTGEVLELVEGRPAGRALDLGCGTGTNCRHLASLGWSVVGIDLSSAAIAAAGTRADGVRFVRGDVSRLAEIGVEGPFDLVIDVGCFHGLSRLAQRRCGRGVAAVTRPGADLLVLGVQRPPATWRVVGATGAPREAMVAAFGADFALVAEEARPGRPAMAVYRLVRVRAEAPAGSRAAGW
jgi:SAM-dependent methyltransferase